MAFDADETLKIQHYLGFSTFYFYMDAELIEVGARAEGEDRVRALLVDLDDVDTRLKLALDNLALVKAEDVEFRGEDELEALRNHGRNLIQRLAILFGVEVGDDYYGSSVDMGGEYQVG